MLRVAAGESLALTQADVRLRGHAVEARLCAEDAEHDFLPSTGEIVAVRFPGPGVRVETGVRAGSVVTPYYDSMLAKLIVHADDRDAALDRLSLALADTQVLGVTTNVRFGAPQADGSLELMLGDAPERASLAVLPSGHRLLHFGGRTLELALVGNAQSIELSSPLGRSVFDCTPYLGGALADAAAGGQLGAPMMGKVVALKAAVGDAVKIGQTVIVLESMKMELHVTAPFDGSVAAVRCKVGDMVERHQVLAEVAPLE
jgi:acetyl/propionyl-CoA carboxylase alpha subunit